MAMAYGTEHHDVHLLPRRSAITPDHDIHGSCAIRQMQLKTLFPGWSSGRALLARSLTPGDLQQAR